MPQYILLLRNEKIDFNTFSPEDYKKLVRDFDQWNAELSRTTRVLGSASLKDAEGKTLRRTGEGFTVDGPYCETKEAVAGFFLIEAENYEQATGLAQGCPFLPLGGSVEVRAAHVELEEAPETKL